MQIKKTRIKKGVNRDLTIVYTGKKWKWTVSLLTKRKKYVFCEQCRGKGYGMFSHGTTELFFERCNLCKGKGKW